MCGLRLIRREKRRLNRYPHSRISASRSSSSFQPTVANQCAKRAVHGRSSRTVTAVAYRTVFSCPSYTWEPVTVTGMRPVSAA